MDGGRDCTNVDRGPVTPGGRWDPGAACQRTLLSKLRDLFCVPTSPASCPRSTPRGGTGPVCVAGGDRIMALFLEIVGAAALVVLAIVVILIAYFMWLVHRAERRDARRWR